MHARLLFLFLRTVALGVSLMTSAAPPHLTLVTEEYPPYNLRNPQGVITGVSTDIVHALMKSAGYTYEISLYPWARAIQMAQVEHDTCVYSMSRTPERESLYKWIGPLVANEWALFAVTPLKPISALSDVSDARIGSYQGDAIVNYLNERHFKVDVAATDDVNPKKLLAKRIDYWATGKLIGQYRLMQQGITNIAPLLVFNRTDMYLACHRGLTDEQVGHLNRQLTELRTNGTIKKIYQAYGYSL